MADIIARHFPEQKHRLPPYDQSKVGQVGEGHFQCDSSKCVKDLDFKFIDLETSVVDTARQLFNIEKKLKA